MSREKPYLSTDLAQTPLNKLQVENKPQIDKFLSNLLLNQEMIINIYQLKIGPKMINFVYNLFQSEYGTKLSSNFALEHYLTLTF